MEFVGSETSDIKTAEESYFALAPSAARAAAVDRRLRSRLIDSLRYLVEFAALEGERRAGLKNLEARLWSGPVSPWVFGLYARLVGDLSRDPSSDPTEDFDALLNAAAIPAEGGVIAFRDPAVAASWWDHFQSLFDTDRKRPFHPQAPTPEAFAVCREGIERGLALIERADQTWHDELRQLVRMIVLGAPSSSAAADLFNGATTFFFWGATLINAEVSRTAVSIADLLVHEGSHGLLFGFSAAGGLTSNSGEQRYASPLRSDPRPIDGIFHGCFVATRVHLLMSRLLDSGRLTADEAKQAVERRDFNGNAARTALDVLAENAKPTELGEQILDVVRAYWAEDGRETRVKSVGHGLR